MVLNRDSLVTFSLQFTSSLSSSRDKIYVMEENDFSEFENLITSLVHVNSQYQTEEVLHCVKCSNEFRTSEAPVKLRTGLPGRQPEQVPVCPQCGSEMIFALADKSQQIAPEDPQADPAAGNKISSTGSEGSVEVVDQNLPQKTMKKSSESTQSVTSKASGSMSSLPATSIIYSYADFSQVDHRLRLFCEMSVMSEVSEEFFGLVKGGILTSTEPEHTAVLVVTSHRFYILKITGSESEQPDKWLQKIASFRLSQLCCLMTILGNQGFILQFNKDSTLYLYLFLLRDEKRTKNFLQFYSDVMERMQQKKSLIDLSANQKNAIEGLFKDPDTDIEAAAAAAEETDLESDVTFIICCAAELDPSRTVDSSCAVFIDSNNVSLISGDFHWLLSHKARLDSRGVSKALRQPIANLVSLESFISQPEKLRLYFLDETSGLKEEWTVTLATRESVDQLVDNLRSPWEAIFSVELDVNELDE